MALTEGEQLGRLEEKLDAALAEFDDLLLTEQRRLAEQAEIAGAAGAGDWGMAGAGASGAGTTGATRTGSAGGDTGTGEPPAGGELEAEGGGGTGTSGAPVPPDVGDGADDDIIARQLREAAMAETDPELREKLWDEYRRYKESIRKGG
jgi:hypothetical protein